MDSEVFDFLSDIPDASKEEVFETIVKNENIKIERIVSSGQTTPSDYWYDQTKDEFVLVIDGEAKIKYDDGTIFDLKKGSSLYIKAKQKHQVIYTADKTIWLAIFVENKDTNKIEI